MAKVLFDFYCCEGGGGMGYYLAGFDHVVGVDIKRQRRYPFEFHQADSLDVLDALLAGETWQGYTLNDVAAFHASPPCQHDSVTHKLNQHIIYPRLIAPTRSRLVASGKPWILENVVGAPMWHGVQLCGTMFGLPIQRHRRFDSSHWLYSPGPCRHGGLCLDITGEKVRHWRDRNSRGYRTESVHLGVDAGRAAMQMPWATLHGLCEAIPPAYTRWLGEQLMAAVLAQAA